MTTKTDNLEKKIEEILYSEMGFYSYDAKLKLLALFKDEMVKIIDEYIGVLTK